MKGNAGGNVAMLSSSMLSSCEEVVMVIRSVAISLMKIQRHACPVPGDHYGVEF